MTEYYKSFEILKRMRCKGVGGNWCGGHSEQRTLVLVEQNGGNCMAILGLHRQVVGGSLKGAKCCCDFK